MHDRYYAIVLIWNCFLSNVMYKSLILIIVNSSRVNINAFLFKDKVSNSSPLQTQHLKELRIYCLKNWLGHGIIKFVTIGSFKVSNKIATDNSWVQFLFILPIRPYISWTSQIYKYFKLYFLPIQSLWVFAVTLVQTLLSIYVTIFNISPYRDLGKVE